MRALAKAGALGGRHTWLWSNRSAFADMAQRDKPRLLVDVSTIIRHDAQTGIQRVVRAVWSELRRRSGAHFDVVPIYAGVRQGYRYAPLDFLRPNEGKLSGDPVAMGPNDKFIGLDLAAHLLPRYRRQFQAWKAQGASMHLIVYDLLPLLRREWFNPSTIANFRRWYSVLENDADQAICISDQVAGELRARLQRRNGNGPGIARMQLGADIAASIPSKGVCGKVTQLLERVRFRPAVLMVGTIEPRKGYDLALRTFEHLWRTRPAEAPDLVIVGKPGWKTDALQAEIRSHPEQGRRLHWLTEVTDEGLCRLYDACRGVFVASRAEGFGLPLLEAAMSRRHVLARDLSVFREQGLANVTYFVDEDVDALGLQLIALVTRGQARPLPTADLPTWSDSVDGLLSQLRIAPAKDENLGSGLRKAS